METVKEYDRPMASANANSLVAQNARGIVFARQFDELGKAQPLLVVPQKLNSEGQGWIWVHLDLVDRRSLLWVEGLNLPAEAVLEFQSLDLRPLIDHENQTLFGSIAEMATEHLGHSVRERLLRFIISEDFIITGRYHPLQGIDSVRQLVDFDVVVRHPTEVLEMIVEDSIARVEKQVDGMLQAVNRIEDLVITRSGTGASGEISTIRRNVVTIHREISIYKAIFRRFAKYNIGMNVPREVSETADSIVARIEALQGEVHALQERARLLKEEIASNVAGEINKSLYILSLVSAILLPPSLVFGLFGTNVGGLPLAENKFGFLLVVLMGVLSSAIVIFLMRRKS